MLANMFYAHTYYLSKPLAESVPHKQSITSDVLWSKCHVVLNELTRIKGAVFVSNSESAVVLCFVILHKNGKISAAVLNIIYILNLRSRPFYMLRRHAKIKKLL